MHPAPAQLDDRVFADAKDIVQRLSAAESASSAAPARPIEEAFAAPFRVHGG
jgi:hypothetical protein